MANYLNIVTSTHKTLSANTADRVTFADNFQSVRIKNRGTTDDLYVRLGSTNPVVAGDATYVVSAGESLTINNDWLNDEVRLISAGAIAYSVMGIDRLT